MDSFDEAYARYLKYLSLLDRTDDIGEKNLLFRQLTQLLSDLEHRLHCSDTCSAPELNCEEADFSYTS